MRPDTSRTTMGSSAQMRSIVSLSMQLSHMVLAVYSGSRARPRAHMSQTTLAAFE